MTFSDVNQELAQAKEIFLTNDDQTMDKLEASYVASDSPGDDPGQLLAVAAEKMCVTQKLQSKQQKALAPKRKGKAMTEPIGVKCESYLFCYYYHWRHVKISETQKLQNMLKQCHILL